MVTRVWVGLLLLALMSAPARADRVWSGPTPIVGARQEAIDTRVGPDGTTVSAWNSSSLVGDPLYASVDGHAAVNLGPSFPFGAQVAAGRNGDAIVIWQADGPNGEVTMVAYSTPEGGFSTPVNVGDGTPVDLAMNDQGEAALVVQNPEAFCSQGPCPAGAPARTVELFRPAGGTFGSPADLPVYGEGGLALTPSGEALIGIYTGAALTVVSRVRDGAVSAPATVATESVPPQVRLYTDVRGDALATWVTSIAKPGEQQYLRVADRPAGGQWTAPATISTLVDPLSLGIGVGRGGDAVLAWRDKEALTHPVVAVTGSLSDGVFSSPTTVDREDGRQLSVGVAPDGTAVIATVGFPSSTVRVIGRDETGPFTPAQVAACAADSWVIGNNYRVADVAGVSDDGTTWLRVNSGLLHDAPGSASNPTCGEPSAGAAIPPTYDPEVPMAGRPVTLDARGVLRPDRDLLKTAFGFGARQTGTGTATALTHTFAKPGRHHWTVTTDQRRRFDGATERLTDRFIADVFGHATLQLAHRTPGAIVVRAGAFSDDRRVPVTILVQRGDRTLGTATRRLSSSVRRVRIPIPSRQRATRLILRQAHRSQLIQRLTRSSASVKKH